MIFTFLAKKSIQISTHIYIYIYPNKWKAQNRNIVDVLSSFRTTLYDTRMMSRSIISIQICFVSHLDNSVADGVAKSAFCLLSSSFSL